MIPLLKEILFTSSSSCRHEYSFVIVEKEQFCYKCYMEVNANEGMYSCVKCNELICLECYQKRLIIPQKHICLPFHSLFDSDIKKSLIERGYALMEFNSEQEQRFFNEYSKWNANQNTRTILMNLEEEERGEERSSFVNELHSICHSYLPEGRTSGTISNLTICLPSSSSTTTVATTALLATKTNIAPPILSGFILNENFCGKGLNVVDGRMPGLWLDISNSLSIGQNKTYLMLISGENNQPYRNCMKMIRNNEENQEGSSYITLEIRDAYPTKIVRKKKLNFLLFRKRKIFSLLSGIIVGGSVLFWLLSKNGKSSNQVRYRELFMKEKVL